MKRLILLLLALALCLGLAACSHNGEENLPPETETQVPTTAPTEDPRQIRYDGALALLKAEDYDAAREEFAALGDFADAEQQVLECDYRKAASLLAAGDNRAAYDLYGTIAGYKDADTLRESCRFVTLLVKTTSEVDDEDRFEIIYTYENGILTESVTKYNTGHPQYVKANTDIRVTYEYQGNSTTMRTYDSKDVLQNIEIKYLDSSGNLIRHNGIYVNSPTSNYTYTYSYDEMGNRVEWLVWSGDAVGEGEANYKHTYEYDDRGNLTQQDTFSWSKLSRYSSYKWNLTDSVYYEYGIDDYGVIHWYSAGDTTTEYTYNSLGQVETEVCEFSGYLGTTSYTYDEAGNVIQEHNVLSKDGNTTRTIIRYIYEPVELFPGDAPQETQPIEETEE